MRKVPQKRLDVFGVEQEEPGEINYMYLQQRQETQSQSANGVIQQNGSEGRHLMESKNSWRLTRRGWIVCVVLPAVLVVSLFTWATRDVCYVGEGGNWLGYGSCSTMIDNVVGK